MQIITVIPISRGISKDTLTYFAKEEVSLGSIVSIPLRNKKSYGLVVECREAEELKSELKSLSYSIKKIDLPSGSRENVGSYSFLSKSFIESAKKIADYNASSLGAVLSVLIPTSILTNSQNLRYVQKKPPSGVFHEVMLLQSDDEERYATYKSFIREEFARGHSVIFCLPTTEDLLNASGTLEKGIEKFTYTLHGSLPKKEIVKKWKEIVESSHPLLVVCTGSFLSLPISNLGSIILEKESSRSYKMQSRPFIDTRQAVEVIAKDLNIRLILGDTLLRIETLWDQKNGSKNTTYSELSPLKFRFLVTTNCEIVNMRSPQDMKKKEFAIFGDRLKQIIKNSIENNEHIFLFCGRKGLFPMTVCSDCGTVVVCKNCKAPVVLYSRNEVPITPSKTSTNKNNLFVCHHCGERRDASELCVHCNGWRLNPLGIGTERVATEISNLFPNSKVILMDKENIKTHKQAVKLRELFYSTPGSIMVGTEMAINYLNQKIENVAVVSMDSYFSIPDFQINEKIFHILLSLRTISQKNMTIQTRQENTKIFEYIVRGNLIDFYRDEIEDRKEIGYPPFTTYIKITMEGEKSLIKKEMEKIAEFLKPYELNIFDAWNPGNKSRFTIHGLISLPRGKWVDKALLEKLRTLPQHCMIRIDPTTLL